MLGEDKVLPDRGIAHPRTPRATQAMMHFRSLGLSLAAFFLGGLFASSAAILPVKPTLIPVAVTLAANNVTVPQGTAVILTATVTPSTVPPAADEQNPTGTIVFLNGTLVIGQSALSALPVANASTATLTVQSLPAGQESITAYYAGDTFFASGTSNPLAISVRRIHTRARRRPIRPLISISRSANPVRNPSSSPAQAATRARCRPSARWSCRTT